jgi:hypothetical protein
MAEGDLTGTWRNYQIAAGAVGIPELAPSASAALAGGFNYIYSTNVEATDPGAGKLKFDKAVLAEAIALRISETDTNGNAIAAWLATLDDSTNTVKGTIALRKVGEPKAFALFNVTGALVDNGTWDSLAVTYILSSGLANNDEVTLTFYRAGDVGAKGAEGAKGTTGERGATDWTPIIDASIKQLSSNSFEKATNVEGDATLRSTEGFTRGCYLTYVAGTSNKGFGLGLNTDPATDEGFAGIDYWINCNSAGTIIIRESGVEKFSGVGYVVGDVLSITYDGVTVRYWKNGEQLREVARAIGSPLFLDSWWNQEGGKAENVHFGPMGEKGTTGSTGATGNYAGVPFEFDASVVAANPGKGKARFNNAAIGSVTKIYVNKETPAGTNLASYLNEWAGDAGNVARGYLTIVEQGTEGYSEWKITGLSAEEGGAWFTVTVEFLNGNPAWAAADVLMFQWARTGNKGTAGAEGGKGATGEAGSALAVLAATREALPTNTLTGNVLEATANGELSITAFDNSSAVAGDSVLVKNEVEGKKNGVYVIVSLGTAGTKYKLERDPRMATSAQCVSGMLISISKGTGISKQEDSVMMLTTNAPITLNTTALAFAFARTRPAEEQVVAASIGDLKVVKEFANGAYGSNTKSYAPGLRKVYFIPILCPHRPGGSFTGIRYIVGAVSSGEVWAGLYYTGLLLSSTAKVAQAAANTAQQVPVTVTEGMRAGIWHIGIMLTSETGTWVGFEKYLQRYRTETIAGGATQLPNSSEAGAEEALNTEKVPLVSTY